MSSKLTVFFFRRTLMLIFLLVHFSLSSQETTARLMKQAQESFAHLDAADRFQDNLNQVDMNRLPSGTPVVRSVLLFSVMDIQ